MRSLHYRYVSLYCLVSLVALLTSIIFDIRHVSNDLCAAYFLMTLLAVIPMKSFVNDMEALGWKMLGQTALAFSLGFTYCVAAVGLPATLSGATLPDHHGVRLIVFALTALSYICYVVPARLKLNQQ